MRTFLSFVCAYDSVAFSEMAPVGHAAEQQPQLSQVFVFQSLPNGAKIDVRVP